MIFAETSFARAVADFKEFAAENNLPTDILWIFLEDIYCRNVNYFGKELWIKLPLPDENERLAETLYKIGQQKNLGICLHAFAVCEDKLCCQLIIPKDELDSQYLFMGEDVKFTYLIDMPVAQAVKNPFRWKMFSLLPFKYRQGNYSTHLQSKRNLQFEGI